MRAEQQRCRAGDPLLHGRRVEGRGGQSVEVEASRWPDSSADEMRGRGAHRVNGWEVAKHAVKTFVKAVPARVSVSEVHLDLYHWGKEGSGLCCCTAFW